MATLTIYRVELPNGDGPYKLDTVSTWVSPGTWLYTRHLYSSRCPGPEADARLRYARWSGDSWEDGEFRVFGFPSLPLLRRWFTPTARRKLTEAGFVVSIYSVPARSVTLGVAQVVFDRRDAERVGTLSVASLEPTEGVTSITV